MPRQAVVLALTGGPLFQVGDVFCPRGARIRFRAASVAAIIGAGLARSDNGRVHAAGECFALAERIRAGRALRRAQIDAA